MYGMNPKSPSGRGIHYDQSGRGALTTYLEAEENFFKSDRSHNIKSRARNAPNGYTASLLFLKAKVEFQFSCLLIPNDLCPVPRPIDILRLGGRAIRCCGEQGQLQGRRK